MNLPNDIARCDGLLPKPVRMPDGSAGVLWAIDCPKREACARYCQIDRDVVMNARRSEYSRQYVMHYHGPSEVCSDFIHE